MRRGIGLLLPPLRPDPRLLEATNRAQDGKLYGFNTDTAGVVRPLEQRITLEKAKIPMAAAKIAMIPKNTVQVEGKNVAGLMRLIDALEDLDDVQNVYANYDVSDEVMEKIDA